MYIELQSSQPFVSVKFYYYIVLFTVMRFGGTTASPYSNHSLVYGWWRNFAFICFISCPCMASSWHTIPPYFNSKIYSCEEIYIYAIVRVCDVQSRMSSGDSDVEGFVLIAFTLDSYEYSKYTFLCFFVFRQADWFGPRETKRPGNRVLLCRKCC